MRFLSKQLCLVVLTAFAATVGARPNADADPQVVVPADQGSQTDQKLILVEGAGVDNAGHKLVLAVGPDGSLSHPVAEAVNHDNVSHQQTEPVFNGASANQQPNSEPVKLANVNQQIIQQTDLTNVNQRSEPVSNGNENIPSAQPVNQGANTNQQPLLVALVPVTAYQQPSVQGTSDQNVNPGPVAPAGSDNNVKFGILVPAAQPASNLNPELAAPATAGPNDGSFGNFGPSVGRNDVNQGLLVGSGPQTGAEPQSNANNRFVPQPEQAKPQEPFVRTIELLDPYQDEDFYQPPPVQQQNMNVRPNQVPPVAPPSSSVFDPRHPNRKYILIGGKPYYYDPNLYYGRVFG